MLNIYKTERSDDMAHNNRHIHGGNIYSASQHYGIDPRNILDYSANINPLGVPSEMKEIIISDINNLVNYPDTECSKLAYQISKYLNVPEDMIITGNGAAEIIYLLFEVLKPKNVLIPFPTFAEYAKAAEKFGVKACHYRLKEQSGFRLEVNEFIAAIHDDIDCAFLCNPNNPTSTLVGKYDLIKLLDYTRERNVSLVIDEAFIEMTVDGNKNSMVDCLDKYDNLFIIRAFTKVFAIPGLRLGYGLGKREIIKRMWESKLPWSVNSLACSSGRFLLQSGEYLEKTSEWLAKEKKYMYDQLNSLDCLKVFEPQTNFILIKIRDDNLTSSELRDKMAQKGILIRDACNFMYLDNSFFRVAVKDRINNDKFLRVLRETLYECINNV